MPSTAHHIEVDPGIPTLRSEVPKDLERAPAVRIQVGDAIREVSGPVASRIVDLVDGAAGISVEFEALPPELTTGQAADLLGVSRPTVVDLADKGALPSKRIGTHRRLPTAEVLAYRERRHRERRGAVDEITQLSQDLGQYDS